MGDREYAKALIDRIPETKLYYIIGFLQGAAVPNEMPNDETIKSFQEIENGGGMFFSGSTADLFAELMED